MLINYNFQLEKGKIYYWQINVYRALEYKTRRLKISNQSKELKKFFIIHLPMMCSIFSKLEFRIPYNSLITLSEDSRRRAEMSEQM